MKGIAISLLAVGTVVAGGASPSEASVFELGEILVSAPGERGEAASDTVRGEEMRAHDAQTVSQAIDRVPGVTLSRGGARNEEMVSVRGFTLRQVPVLIDGIPVYVPYDGNVDLGRFTTFDLSKIEVAKDGGSVLTGPNALGGVINLVTRKPTKALEGELESGVRFGDGGYNGAYSAFSAGSRQDLGWVQGSGSWSKLEGFSLADGVSGRDENGGYRGNSAAEDIKLNLKAAITPRDDDEYALNLIYQHGEKGNPPYMGDDRSVTSRYWQWPKWDKRSLYWLSRTGLSESWSLKTRAYYDSFVNRLKAFDDKDYDTQTRGSSFTSYYDDYSVGGSSEVGGDLAEWSTLKLAAHFKQDVHREHNAGEPTRTDIDNTWSFGAEHTAHVTRDLDLITGLSYDWRDTLKAEDYQNKAITDFPLTSSDAVNWQIKGVYRYSDTGALHASMAYKSRFPTLKDRYSYRMGRGLPNASLEAERAATYELGVEQTLFGNTRIDASVFHSAISDAIESVALTRNVSQMQNVGDAIHQGLELGIHTTVLPRTELGVSYTLLNAQNEKSAIHVTDAPRHKGVIYGAYALTDALSVRPSVTLASERYSDTAGTKVDGYIVSDLAVRYDVTEAISLEAGVNNILDTRYELSEGYPEEGRNYFLKGKVTF
ncbi:TonB-dependent receptor [Rhodospirillum rubrum]|uniref:TonB-dependent receptor plug domain-containing protein n=1 Tax=Rhodospirillum rubrum TaxID=1085 RepID=UPI001905807B|nr:TonB-dependent receptor [Rhodospirillum rubrum]MBK1663406.1 TonB-dependent receptor [Rhodospirillum rubrum]MBK1675411.1 TonB-dependent receptor [Rhodospirillum rubrum]